jgi:hypothetical protein
MIGVVEHPRRRLRREALVFRAAAFAVPGLCLALVLTDSSHRLVALAIYALALAISGALFLGYLRRSRPAMTGRSGRLSNGLMFAGMFASTLIASGGRAETPLLGVCAGVLGAGFWFQASRRQASAGTIRSPSSDE